MAGIDKTYVSSYEDWKAIIDWCRDKKFTCPNGMILYPINYCYDSDASKEDIENWLKNCEEIPVMNTSWSIDYFLIKYCPIKVVQERMIEVYSKEYVHSILDGTSEFDTYIRPEEGKHIKWIKKPSTNFVYKWYNSYLKKWIVCGYSVQIDGDLWYNEDYDCWVHPYELGYWTSNTADTNCKSIKALIRKILKWNLPAGTKVHFFGKYKDEKGTILITK